MRFLALLLCTFLFAGAALADDYQAELKKSFLNKWEEQQLSLPYVTHFEKIAEGLYEYNITLFPYSGQLRVSNIVISPHLQYYLNYNLEDYAILKGAVEVELLGLDREKIAQQYPLSFDLWRRDQYLFQFEENGPWLSEHEWEATYKDNYEEESCGTSEADSKHDYYMRILKPFAPLFIFLVIMIAILSWSRRLQAKNTKMWQDANQKSLELIKESLALQKEQRDLLKKIAKEKPEPKTKKE
ncbi:MAG: hypothetical protein GC137_05110 [Alphaproteobacteria bacterium]|nr:hypothetical protein [Alphaproteobacteria bacterium]